MWGELSWETDGELIKLSENAEFPFFVWEMGVLANEWGTKNEHYVNITVYLLNQGKNLDKYLKKGYKYI